MYNSETGNTGNSNDVATHNVDFKQLYKTECKEILIILLCISGYFIFKCYVGTGGIESIILSSTAASIAVGFLMTLRQSRGHSSEPVPGTYSLISINYFTILLTVSSLLGTYLFLYKAVWGIINYLLSFDGEADGAHLSFRAVILLVSYGLIKKIYSIYRILAGIQQSQ
jgi:hypothetical protein